MNREAAISVTRTCTAHAKISMSTGILTIRCLVIDAGLTPSAYERGFRCQRILRRKTKAVLVGGGAAEECSPEILGPAMGMAEAYLQAKLLFHA